MVQYFEIYLLPCGPKIGFVLKAAINIRKERSQGQIRL